MTSGPRPGPEPFPDLTLGMRPTRCLPQPLISQPRAPRHSLVLVTPHLLASLLVKSWRDPGEKHCPVLSARTCTPVQSRVLPSTAGAPQLPRAEPAASPQPRASQVLPDPCSPKPHVSVASALPAHRKVLGCVGAPVCAQRPREEPWSFCVTPGELGTAVPMACREGWPQPCRTMPQNADLWGPGHGPPTTCCPSPSPALGRAVLGGKAPEGAASVLAGLDSWASASWWLRRRLLLGGSQRL